MNKSVAIILATFNGERWLAEQIHSLLAQTHARWTLFIRDDLSTDGTLALAQQFARRDSRIRLLPSPTSQCGSAAGNFLLALLLLPLDEFDCVAFCDQDDIWAPGKLSSALERLQAEDAEAYSCDLVAFDNGSKSCHYIAKTEAQCPLDYLFQGASAGCTYVLTSKAAALVCARLGQDPVSELADKSHDWLVYAICRSHGMSWCHEPAAHIFYRQHAGNAYGAMQRWSGWMRKFAMVRSGWYRRHILWNRRFLAQSGEEDEVLRRVDRFGWADRFWLASRTRLFRRDRKQSLILALWIVFGLI